MSELHKYANGIILSEVELTEGEVDAYLKMGRDRYGSNLLSIDVKADDNPDYLQIKINPRHVSPFERIRRITGYLVGTLDRFNDAKRAEEADRVKHEVR